jgi:hypothetical protein
MESSTNVSSTSKNSQKKKKKIARNNLTKKKKKKPIRLLARLGDDRTRPHGWADKPRRSTYDHIEVTPHKAELDVERHDIMPRIEKSVLLPNTESALRRDSEASAARDAARAARGGRWLSDSRVPTLDSKKQTKQQPTSVSKQTTQKQLVDQSDD